MVHIQLGIEVVAQINDRNIQMPQKHQSAAKRRFCSVCIAASTWGNAIVFSVTHILRTPRRELPQAAVTVAHHADKAFIAHRGRVFPTADVRIQAQKFAWR